MSNIEQTVFCNGCGVEITWAPIVKGNRRYCCEDCLVGRGCECATRQDLDDDGRGGQHGQQTPTLTGTP
jgi:hypothetical protein